MSIVFLLLQTLKENEIIVIDDGRFFCTHVVTKTFLFMSSFQRYIKKQLMFSMHLLRKTKRRKYNRTKQKNEN